MTKAVAATCLNGVVKIGTLEVPEAVILSAGVGSSSGICFFDKDKIYYVTSVSSDLETTLAKVIDALTQLASTLTSIGAGMTGITTAPPPTLATDVAALNTIKAALTTLKGQLK